ncbi:MAG: RagB/SusD family nutrient uptake outer membrane protein [Bacteroidota bacterium]
MKKNKILIFSFLLLSLAGCKKVIDVKETDFIGGDIALKTTANNEQGIIGAYAGLTVDMGILLNGVMSDELRVADFYNSATAHEWQYSSTDIVLRDNFTAFPLYYKVIDRANRVLAALPNATSTGAADDALKLKLRGEALFLRAFAHFELYRFYSNSAVGTDLALAYLDAPSLAPQARITVAPYMTKLKADMAEAKTLVPNNLTDIARATKLAVSGLQARVALYLKEYSDAVTYTTEYIAGLPLASKANFPGIWTDAVKDEIAFKLIRTTATARLGSLYRGTSASSANIGTITWRPSDKLWNSYDQVNDVRFASYLKNEPLLPSNRSSTKLIYKYAGTTYGTASENVADQKVFRTGEMYLIRAEAKAEGGDLAGAATDLNTLRAARINGYVNATFADKNAVINAIMDERFKELAFEGHRFWDLKRRNLPVSRDAADAPNAAATSLPAGNFRFLLPIPNSEIQANPLIQQNPGYTN